jgi:hypothetical protein
MQLRTVTFLSAVLDITGGGSALEDEDRHDVRFVLPNTDQRIRIFWFCDCRWNRRRDSVPRRNDFDCLSASINGEDRPQTTDLDWRARLIASFRIGQ